MAYYAIMAKGGYYTDYPAFVFTNLQDPLECIKREVKSIIRKYDSGILADLLNVFPVYDQEYRDWLFKWDSERDLGNPSTVAEYNAILQELSNNLGNHKVEIEFTEIDEDTFKGNIKFSRAMYYPKTGDKKNGFKRQNQGFSRRPN